jgi:hypothetical protein
MASLGDVTVTLAFDDAVAALTAIRDRAATCHPGLGAEALADVHRLAQEALNKIQLGKSDPATGGKGMARAINDAVAREREACALAAESALCDQGTDDPHEALRWAAAAIRARGGKPGWEPQWRRYEPPEVGPDAVR